MIILERLKPGLPCEPISQIPTGMLVCAADRLPSSVFGRGPAVSDGGSGYAVRGAAQAFKHMLFYPLLKHVLTETLVKVQTLTTPTTVIRMMEAQHKLAKQHHHSLDAHP